MRVDFLLFSPLDIQTGFQLNLGHIATPFMRCARALIQVYKEGFKIPVRTYDVVLIVRDILTFIKDSGRGDGHILRRICILLLPSLRYFHPKQ